MSCTQTGVIADLVRAEDRGREGGRRDRGGRESDEKSLNQLLPLSSVREATTDSTHPPTYHTAPLAGSFLDRERSSAYNSSSELVMGAFRTEG